MPLQRETDFGLSIDAMSERLAGQGIWWCRVDRRNGRWAGWK